MKRRLKYHGEIAIVLVPMIESKRTLLKYVLCKDSHVFGDDESREYCDVSV